MKANPKLLCLVAVLTWVSVASYAGQVGPITIFAAGTPAKASEVNGNFSAVSTAVNDTDARTTTIETHVTPAGNIVLGTSTANAGNILKGAAPFIHNFGTSNTFIGVSAGNLTMTGNSNAASGHSALFNNTSGSDNTAIGASALQSNTTGFNNTATGTNALLFNTTGSVNTASGQSALFHNTTGDSNVASGVSALLNNTIGASNTAIGTTALTANATGNINTAVGAGALSGTTGSANIGIGFNAGSSLTTGSNNIDIGNVGIAAESNTIRIGIAGTQTATFIAGISGATSSGGVLVFVNGAGQLGTLTSSRRFKDDIADMGNASSALMKLRPVTFHYKSDKNPNGRTLQYGLVAEEVAKVAPGLVAHSADGKIETVYYQFLAPMLLNEYQKQQRTIAVQTARIAQLEKQSAEIAELKQQLTRMAGLLGRLEEARVASAGR